MTHSAHRQITLLLVAIMAMMPLRGLEAALYSLSPDLPQITANAGSQTVTAHLQADACPTHQTSGAANDYLCSDMGCDLCGTCVVALLPPQPLTSHGAEIPQITAVAPSLPQIYPNTLLRPPQA